MQKIERFIKKRISREYILGRKHIRIDDDFR